jgi:hypothetical protein
LYAVVVVLDTVSAAVVFLFACVPDSGHCRMSHVLTVVIVNWIEPFDGALGVVCMISLLCFLTVVSDKYVLMMK